MSIKVTILGTSSAAPTKERAHSATLLDIGPEAFLFDAGESVQRQLAFAGASPMKISKIFLSHWDGDHSLGLGGLLQSMQLNKRAKKLELYGPEGTRERFNHLVQAFGLKVQYPLDLYEIKAGSKPFKILDSGNYEIFATKCRHPTACLAFAYVEKPKRRIDASYLKKFGLVHHPLIKELQQGKDITWKGKTRAEQSSAGPRKTKSFAWEIKAKDATYIQAGKKFVYLVDSAYIDSLAEFAKAADLLVCEATFMAELMKEAKEFGHMTSVDAAMLAKKAKAKQLVLTHFSQRYKDVSELLKEAKKVFPNTIAAKDLMTIDY